MPAFYLDPGRKIREKELHSLEKWGVTGIIMREVKNNEELIGMGVPVIVSTYIHQKVEGACEIYVNNKAIGEMAAEHLLRLGFKNFAFCGFDDFFWSKEREQGFKERIKAAGFQTIVYKQPKSQVKRLWDNEQVILADWLKSLPKPIGLMACIDERSQDVIEACKTAGIHVPEEIAIIGGDNDDLICDLANPPLSSVAVSGVRAGYQAAELLDKLMAGKEELAGQKIIVEPTHVEARQSTDILAIDDREIVMAIRFIRQHAREPIQVNDVVEATRIGRRRLEKKFQRIVGRSVHDEIKQTRIEEVAKMLRNTNLSISVIAMTLGYSSVNNIARYFRQEKGMSLLAYRNLYGGEK
ncbi:MAG: hypothetical protein DRP62_03620 [Planctomycetota bacterium]|nr:MAG: hypothetical protein DRP62_03620 [Planctomycetota bacterium]